MKTAFFSSCWILFLALAYGFPDVKIPGLITGDEEICMKELGCFSITPDFKSLLHRPINFLPHDRATINTRCLLYTRQNAKEAHQLIAKDESTFTESHFNAANPTKFIVHGFMDSDLYGPWMTILKDEFLMHSDYNIIVVDWSGGNKPPYYQASSNTRVVGAEIALIVETLEKVMGAKREEFHIIGHSLGSHVAGYAGERLKTLGRITGCDPAEPYFQNMPPSVRLDPTDADFVDVIHSDATDVLFLGFGMSHPAGHVDFYPNNGRDQPGCNKEKAVSFPIKGFPEGARRFFACNHQRSLDFMEATINFKKVVPVGYECQSWKLFLDGKCSDCGKNTEKCAIMGMRADEYKPFKNDSVSRMMYLKTTGKTPFWMHHYQVTLKLNKPSVAANEVKGTLEMTLVGSRGDHLAHVQKQYTEFHHGATYKFLITTEKDLGEIKSVSLKYKYWNPMAVIIKKPKMFVEYITVVPMNTIEASPRNNADRMYCKKPIKGVEHNTLATFHKSDKCRK